MIQIRNHNPMLRRESIAAWRNDIFILWLQVFRTTDKPPGNIGRIAELNLYTSQWRNALHE